MSNLLNDIRKKLAQRDVEKLKRVRRVVESPCAPYIQVEGERVLSFASNDYLGLASHPEIIHALQEGALLYGAGSGASHLISGHSKAHFELEETLETWLAPYAVSPRALYFCTGYMANLAILTVLVNDDVENTEIFSEQLNHASLIDGIRLSKARVQVYSHNDMGALENALKHSKAKNKIVVTDSVFSMDGDIAPLPELLTLCEQYDAWLVVDDAHGFGVLGDEGRGVLAHFNLCSDHVIYMGTLGKAAGVGGAFVLAHELIIEWLIQRARSYIYTTAAPPLLAHALLTAIKIIRSLEGQQRRENIALRMQEINEWVPKDKFILTNAQAAIFPLIVGDNETTLKWADYLYAHRIWVPAIRPPTVPMNTARLRLTVSALHTSQDIQQLMSVLQSNLG